MDGDDAAARHRRLGARLLPQLPEPPPGLPRGVVERRQLGGGRPALRDGRQAARVGAGCARSSPAAPASSAPRSRSACAARAGRCSRPGAAMATSRAPKRRARSSSGRRTSSAGSTSSINGASAGFEAKPFEQVSEADVDAALGATVKGSFFVTQAAAPHLRASRGLVVMIEDVAAYQPWPSFRGALRGQGGTGDADADAGEGARPRRAGLRDRAGAGGARARATTWSGVPPRRRCDGSARPTTSPVRSSISRAPTSSPARRSPSTEAGCCKPGRPAMRRPSAWMRH